MSTANTSSKPSVKSINRKEEKVTDKLREKKKRSVGIRKSFDDKEINCTCCHRLVSRTYLKLIEKGTVEITLVAGS